MGNFWSAIAVAAWFILTPILEQSRMARKDLGFHFEPRVTVRSNCIVTYEVPVQHSRSAPVLRVKNNADISLSSDAQKRMKNAINYLIDASQSKKLYSKELNKYFRFKVSFITLTLPSEQIHSDREIHDTIFKDFIRGWKRRNNNLLYIYKAEKQDNGNLHYHLTTNSFIHHKVLRKIWNRCCNLLGYVDRCVVADPNSSDVHSVKNIKSLSSYLCKYMTKKDCYKKNLVRWHRMYDKYFKSPDLEVCHLPRSYFGGIKKIVTIKKWDCSKALKIKPLVLDGGTWETSEAIMWLKANNHKIINVDYASIFVHSRGPVPTAPLFWGKYQEHIRHIVEINKGVNHILEAN